MGPHYRAVLTLSPFIKFDRFFELLKASSQSVNNENSEKIKYTNWPV